MAEPAVKLAEVTGDQYQTLMSAFPAGVAAVTARDACGRPCGMTCSSLAVLFGRVARVVQFPDTPLLYGRHRFSAWNPPDGAAPPHDGVARHPYRRKDAE